MRSWNSIAGAALALGAMVACAQPQNVPTSSADAPTAKPEATAESSQQRHGLPAAGLVSFDASKAPQLESLRLKSGHMLVKAVLNGIDAGWFIFDTGAGICCISTPHVSRFGLEPAGEISSQGIGGKQQSGLFRASTLSLGPMTLKDHTLMATDLAFLKPLLGEEIVGVIGFGVLSQCVSEIDAVEGRVAVHDPVAFTPKGCEWISIDLFDRIPALKARVEEHEGLFHIDTGANSGVSVAAHTVARWNLLEGREVKDAKLGGVGGFVATKEGSLASLEIGGQRQENVPATFALEAKGVLGGERIDGSLGAGALRPYVLVTDYSNERIALRPRKD